MLAAAHPTPATSLALAPAFAVGRGAVSLGRGDDNQVSALALNSAAPQPLPDKLVHMVSRRHARLEVVAGQLELADLGAVNGTFVNDMRMEHGSRRVLQENDVVSLGGPSTISLRGVPRPNPWVWRVRCLHEFLASYVPPSQGLPPAAAAGLAPLAAAPPAGPPPPREMYSFSPKPAVAVAAAGALPPGTILPAALPEEQPAAEEAEEPEEPAAEEEGEEEEAVEDEDEVPSSPGVPAATGSCPPGSMPVGSPAAAMLAPVAAPAPAKAAAEAAAGAHLEGTDLLPEDSEEAAQLAALEALEASQLAMGAAPRASPQEHQQPMQQPGPAAQQGPQQGQQQGQQLQGRRPPQLMVPRRAEPEVVDLTADSPSPTSPQRRRALVPPARLGGGRAGTAAGAAAAAGAGGADVVDLLADVSPTKRPHGTQDEVDQGAKRARPSPEAHLQPRPAAAAEAAAQAPGAAGAGAAAGGAAGHLDELHESAPVCAICQELPVVTHSMVPCMHSFCGECLAGWLAKKQDCPTCRVVGTGPPMRNHDMDKIIGVIAAMGARSGAMSADDQQARADKLATWEEKKAELERALRAPWAARAGAARAAARPAGGAVVGGTLSALAAAILGGGGFGAFGGDPLVLLAGDDEYPGPPMARRSGGRAAPPPRAPQVVPPPARIVVPPQHEYRAEVSARGVTTRCAGCNAAVAELTLRVGQRPQAQRPPAAWRWFHLDCMPAAAWHEARARGVGNLRGVPPADQARIRGHLQHGR